MREMLWVASVLACGCSSAPATPPRVETVEIQVAPPLATAAPSATAVVQVAQPVLAPFDVEFASAGARAWSGGFANVPAPSSITGIGSAGANVVAVGPGFAIHSEDGGVHFAGLAVAELADRPAVWVSARGPIFAAGTRALRSDDHGSSWRVVAQPPGSVYGLWGDSAGAIYAVGGSSSGPPFIARSRDDGASWTTLTQPVKDGWLYAVTGRGSDEVIVVGKEQLAALSTSGEQKQTAAVVLRSTDAGKSWKRLGVFTSTRTEFEESRGVCLTKDRLFVTSTYGLYVTRDWGRSYRLATSFPTEALSLGCHGDDVLVGGRNRKLFSSRDGGATWDEPLVGRFDDPAMISVEAIACDDAGRAFVGLEGAYRDPHYATLFRRAP